MTYYDPSLLYDQGDGKLPSSSTTNRFQSDSFFQPEGSNSFSYAISSQVSTVKKPKMPLKSGKENQGRWSKEEHEIFLKGLEKYGKDWKKIASCIESRTIVQVRTHAQKYLQKLDVSKKEELLNGKASKDDTPTSSDSPVGTDRSYSVLSDLSNTNVSHSFSFPSKDVYHTNVDAGHSESQVNTTDLVRNSSPSLLLSETSSHALFSPLSKDNKYHILSPTTSNTNLLYNNTNVPADPLSTSNTSSLATMNPFANDTYKHVHSEFGNLSDSEYEKREEATTYETLSSLFSSADPRDIIPEDYVYKRRKSSVFDDDVPECFRIEDD